MPFRIIVMEIIYETNGKGFLGWVVEFPGAYIRGKTTDEAREKINNEITAYQKWLDLPLKKEIITKENIVETKLDVEDADSDVLIEYDITEYKNAGEFKNDCEKILISANKIEEIYKNCNYKDVIDETKVRKTFYGDVYSTIRKQYEHIVNVQQYYLNNVETDAEINGNIIESRIKTIEALNRLYIKEGNKYCKTPEEKWTIRKVIRRLIWHDRIHGKAMERMENRIGQTVRHRSCRQAAKSLPDNW
jgi:predicted RNase H-like HicB family nuclease